MRRDQHGVIGLTMVANLVVIALIGVVVFDVGAVLLVRLKVQDVAETAATEGARDYKEHASHERVEMAIVAEIEKRDPEIRLERFGVLPGGSVSVEVRKRPGTLLLHRLSFLKGFVRAHGSATRDPPRGL